jgi:hypothetical protein
MTQLLRGVAITVALTTAAPVWAQAPTTDDLNRQELNRVAAKTAAPIVTPPAIGYSIVLPIAPPQVLWPPAPPQVLVPPVQPNFAAYSDRYPLPWLYRYYGYQAPAMYEYVNLGSGGYYMPVPALPVPYWD